MSTTHGNLNTPRVPIMRRYVHHTFGESLPQIGAIGLSVAPSPVEIFVPENAPMISTENDLKDLLRNRGSCFVNSDSNQETEFFWPPRLSGDYLINYVPTNYNAEPNFGEVHNERCDMEEEPVSEMDIDDGIKDNVLCDTSGEHHSPPPNCLSLYQNFGLPKPPSAPPLMNFMIIVNEVVILAKHKRTLIVEYKPFKIYQENLMCLVPGHNQWLADEVMDYYLAMINARNKSNPAKYAKTYTFRCTFYSLLAMAKGVELVEKTTEGENIFDNELIFVPVCFSHHWRLIVINVANKTIKAYNSWSSKPDVKILKNIARYLKTEYKRIHNNAAGAIGEPTVESPEWTYCQEENVPQQDNGSDCGAFSLVFADYLSRKAAFDFNQDHMNYFRAKILYECISGRLLSD